MCVVEAKTGGVSLDVLVIGGHHRLRDILPCHGRGIGPLDRVIVGCHSPRRDGPARRARRDTLARVAAPHQLAMAAGAVDDFTKAGGRIRRRRPGAQRENAESGGGNGDGFHQYLLMTTMPCPAKCPASPPIRAPFKQPAAFAGGDHEANAVIPRTAAAAMTLVFIKHLPNNCNPGATRAPDDDERSPPTRRRISTPGLNDRFGWLARPPPLHPAGLVVRNRQ